jgi:hypothetical protein
MHSVMRTPIRYPFGRPALDQDALWRCVAKTYANYDPDPIDYGHDIGSHQDVELHYYAVDRRTPCGAWIVLGYGVHGHERRFVHLGKRKQYASNTEGEAVRQFVKRKDRHISILEAQAAAAREARAIAMQHVDVGST